MKIAMFCWPVLALTLAVPIMSVASEVETQTNVPVELSLHASRPHADPFKDVTLDVVFTEPDGTTRRLPAFWAGGDTWKARYASPQVGRHAWHSECNDVSDAGLHGLSGEIKVLPYTGENLLFRHGPVRVAKDHRHFEYFDGTPFFWLGDTWWMGLSHRLHWPEDFKQLAADRKQKGFNVVQIVAGLYPDMPPFDPRGANEAGFPWEKDYARIRPEYFDAADTRLRYLVDQGITPCLVGAWGYFMPRMGVAKMKAHWRYLIARYAALPIIWCAAGEANLPYYLDKGFPFDDREQVHGWTEVLRSIRATDPWRRPLTIHPTAINQYTSRHATDDPALLDFDMLQTPHGERPAGEVAIRAMSESYAAKPTMPVIDGEASYEMLGDSLPTRWTRAMFWLCLTNGAAGHTYGANGIWQVNRRGDPHGKSPHGGSYGVISWDDAMRLPGSEQVALGKKFFESLPWTKLVPMPGAATWSGQTSTVALGDWIWYPEGNPSRDAPIAARFFRRRFDLPKDIAVRSAHLRITADDRFTVWLNGKELGAGADWHQPTVINAAAAIVAGSNVLAVRAENVQAPVAENPAGLAVGLDIELADGSKTLIRSDAKWRAFKTETSGWRARELDDSHWPAAIVAAKFGDAPWGRIGDAEPTGGISPQACGIGKSLIAVYAVEPRGIEVHGLSPNASYRHTLFDPVTGERTTATEVTTDAHGSLRAGPPTHDHDWVVLLEVR